MGYYEDKHKKRTEDLAHMLNFAWSVLKFWLIGITLLALCPIVPIIALCIKDATVIEWIWLSISVILTFVMMYALCYSASIAEHLPKDTGPDDYDTKNNFETKDQFVE